MSALLEMGLRAVCLLVIVSWFGLAIVSAVEWIGELLDRTGKAQGPPDVERIP